jgi:hypothetical protein
VDNCECGNTHAARHHVQQWKYNGVTYGCWCGRGSGYGQTHTITAAHTTNNCDCIARFGTCNGIDFVVTVEAPRETTPDDR